MLLNIAYAATAAAAQEDLAGSIVSNLVPMALICVVFYLLIIRPHQAKMKKHKQMISNLTVGDKIITAGGLVGVVCALPNEHDELMVEIAKNTKIYVMKSAITDVASNNSVSVKQEG